jgi:uncharacterized protein (DUF433 family)
MLYWQVSIDPEIMHGTPCFAGTRVPIQNLFDYLVDEGGLEEFLENFPSVTKEAVGAVLKMATIALTNELTLHNHFG